MVHSKSPASPGMELKVLLTEDSFEMILKYFGMIVCLIFMVQNITVGYSKHFYFCFIVALCSRIRALSRTDSECSLSIKSLNLIGSRCILINIFPLVVAGNIYLLLYYCR